MKVLRRLEDKLWLGLNRKPTGRTLMYFNIVGPWLLVGLLVALFMFVLGVAIEYPAAVLLPVMLGIYVAVYIAFLMRTDYKGGYADALHKHYLKRREERLARIIEEKEKQK